MDYNILLGLLISFSIIYFILHSKLPKKKVVFVILKYRVKFNPYILTAHALMIYIFLLNILSIANVFILLAYIVIHTALDEAVELIKAKIEASASEIYIFCMDKLVRLLLIFTASYIIKVNVPKHATLIMVSSFFDNIIRLFPTQLTYQNKFFIAIFLFIIGLWGVGRFIALLIDCINKNTADKPHETLKAGFIIGILERIFIICSIILGVSQVIGFVLAAKSVARLSKLNDDYFVEIFIIGNFISFIAAIVIGAIIKNLDIFPYLIKTVE